MVENLSTMRDSATQQESSMLDFYFSTMQGGKSTALLQRRYNLTSIGQRVLVMTSALDDRYGVGKVTSRMGPQCEAVLFNKETVFDPALGLDQIDELLIDESQFLTRAQVKQIHQRLCVGMALRVSCYGLRTDFIGDAFEGASALLALADSLHEISTLCRCGEKATMNQRIGLNGAPERTGEVVEIGGDVRYRPVCPNCFY